MPRIVQTIVPFIVLGISIAILIALAILLSYVVLWGIAIGLVLFTLGYLKNTFFPSEVKKQDPKKGRIIEHNKDL